MNRFRHLILFAVIVLSALLAFGLFTLPKPASSDSDGFSAERVLDDIRVISAEPHSVEHPQARAEVRDYLVGRLEELGGEVTLYRYDSLSGARNTVFDAVNILADFPPAKASDDTTFLMFVAHYDSRHTNEMPQGPVLSYGAADDGYGLGVILETVSLLLKDRDEWQHGVKVLFTDAEESGMLGMRTMWAEDRHAFDNVGLMINVEGRGTWGPALLFETSPGNRKLTELYGEAARYPYTYSLTTIVYGFSPMNTDFTFAKDDIPGMNFSTIADVNSYHTDKDNFDNVSARSIQHYGSQIFPVALAYLTDPAYAAADSLKDDSDTTNFTIPGLGFFNFSRNIYRIINIVIFVLFLLVFALEGVRGRLKAMRVFKTSCIILSVAVGTVAIGELIAYVCTLIVGNTFKPFGVVQGVQSDNIVMAVSLAFMLIVSVAVYCTVRRNAMRQKSGSMRASAVMNVASMHAYTVLYGALSLMFILSLVLLFAIGENLMFLIPLCFATLALILWHITSLKVWLAAAVFVILLHAFSFLFALAMALTIGAFGIVAMLTFLDIMVLIPLCDLYLMEKRR